MYSLKKILWLKIKGKLECPFKYGAYIHYVGFNKPIFQSDINLGPYKIIILPNQQPEHKSKTNVSKFDKYETLKL